jgi:hypothetical protein
VALARLIALAAAGLWPCFAFAAAQFALQVGEIEGPYITARGVTAVMTMTAASALELKLEQVQIAGAEWRNVRIECRDLTRKADELACAGAITAPAHVPIDLRYSLKTQAFDIALKPALDEVWRLASETSANGRELVLTLANARIDRIAAWRPATWPKLTGGRVNGNIAFHAVGRLAADLQIADAAFSDASGMHAGDKLALRAVVHAQSQADAWRWQTTLEWLQGEAYWQPVYLVSAGQRAELSGIIDAHRVQIESGRFTFPGVGAWDFSAAFDRKTGRIASATTKTANLDIAALYERVLKPALQGTALGDIRAEGHVDLSVRYEGGTLRAADVTLRKVSFEDRERRFAAFGIDGHLPWDREQPTAGRLQFAGGELFRIPFGGFAVALEMRGIRTRMHDVQIPVLDGSFTVKDFAASGEREGWRWRFAGAMTPVSMERLTAALGVPVMRGTLAAQIPAVTYRDSTVQADGALVFNIFDGTVAAADLVLETPFGKVPRLKANVEMRNLDLDLVTRAYSFGQITGRIDARVSGLEFVNWQPVRFDASIASSAGEYPRRISQTAVQNISALGGAGAAAAVQRSFLRFFGEFRYEALGLNCRLENGVCFMGGIENAPQGYVIVKGGIGVPAITVMGYNRNVGWQELISRLKRITASNVKPVIK